MKVLVATRNKDKFDIVKRILDVAVPGIDVTFLGDTAINGSIDEVGAIEERALQKAKHYADIVKGEYDAVLGIDDGMQVGNEDPTPNSKEFTDRVLGGEWPKGTQIFIVRAYGLIGADGTASSTVTKLPFTFIGNDVGTTPEETKYPLNRVFAQEDGTVPVSEMNSEESKEFDLKYSKEKIEKLFGL